LKYLRAEVFSVTMLEYLGPELPWKLCLTYEDLACEPSYRFFTSARSPYQLFYLQESFVWCQNSVEAFVAAVCPHQPLALRWHRGVLYVLLADGGRYYVLEESVIDGCNLTLQPQGSAFQDLAFFYD
jgi:hypothetical protein